jgi:hypothetical protein
MPIPNPTSSETQNDYVGRCMSEISGEYPQEQAVAICISTYQKETMSKSKQQRVADKMSGIALLQGLEDACWSGYEAIGTKIKDGREVPNCVPVKELTRLAAYPWDECIADQTARYGDEETAKNVCGYIKSKYGSKE